MGSILLSRATGNSCLTSLRDADDIVTIGDGRNTVLLNGRGNLVATEFDVLGHSRMQASCLEAHDRDGANRALLFELDLDHAVHIVSNTGNDFIL